MRSPTASDYIQVTYYFVVRGRQKGVSVEKITIAALAVGGAITIIKLTTLVVKKLCAKTASSECSKKHNLWAERFTTSTDLP